MPRLTRPAFSWLALWSLPVLSGAGGWARGAEITPPASLEAWLPDDSIGYAKLVGAGKRLDEFLGSRFRRDVESLDAVRFLLSRGPWQKFLSELEGFKSATGKEPLKVFQDLLGQEIAAAFGWGSNGLEVTVLTRSPSRDALESGLRAIRAGLASRLGFSPQPVQAEYGPATIETVDKLSYAKLGSVLALSNGRRAIEKVIDLAAGTSKGSILDSKHFERSRGAAPDALLSFAARPRLLPNFPPSLKPDNGLGSLLVGGIAGAIEASELIGGELKVKEGEIGLELASFSDAGGLPEKFKVFFPEARSGEVARCLEERGSLAILEIHRSLAEWWEKREELLQSRAVGGLTEFSQVMSIAFGGRNFQDEVLPELGPTITFVARNQDYADLKEKPRPSIPAFAAVFELKKASEFSTSMIAAFQTIIGIINADRAQKKQEGMAMMLLKNEKVGNVDLHTVDLGSPGSAKPGMAHNFSPGLAIVGNRVVISSSRELARVLAEELGGTKGGGGTAPKESPASDSLVIRSAPLLAVLRENIEFLIADSMLKKGKSKDEAEGEMKTLLDVVNRLGNLHVDLGKEKGACRLKIRLGVAKETGPAAKKEVSL